MPNPFPKYHKIKKQIRPQFYNMQILNVTFHQITYVYNFPIQLP